MLARIEPFRLAEKCPRVRGLPLKGACGMIAANQIKAATQSAAGDREVVMKRMVTGALAGPSAS